MKVSESEKPIQQPLKNGKPTITRVSESEKPVQQPLKARGDDRKSVGKRETRSAAAKKREATITRVSESENLFNSR
ncbi:MAG: hypothetical protein ACLR23_27120 [Clostridia bacterium]